MKKEFLEDYAAKETKEQQKLVELASSCTDIQIVKTSFCGRFDRLNDPIGIAATSESVWPQVPLFGTLIVSLSPLANPRFRAYHGFDIGSIDRLVDFAKDTARVAFVLEEDPTEFAGLDFLDPIFTELKPPLDCSIFQLSRNVSDELNQAKIEFDTLAAIKFYKYVSEITSLSEASGLFGQSANLQNVIGMFRETFTFLSLIGAEQLVQSISDAMVEDPTEAIGLLVTTSEVIEKPMKGSLDSIHNVSRYRIDRLQSVMGERKLGPKESMLPQKYGCEIGKFLLNKLALYPDSFEACRAMCDKYKQSDLYSVMNALQAAIKDEDYGTISSLRQDLSEILENVWQDSQKYQRNLRFVSGGIMVSLAVLGTVAAGPIGAIGGFLAGLGYNVVEKVFDFERDSVSESIAKRITPNYIVNVFDFKKRYNINY